MAHNTPTKPIDEELLILEARQELRRLRDHHVTRMQFQSSLLCASTLWGLDKLSSLQRLTARQRAVFEYAHKAQLWGGDTPPGCIVIELADGWWPATTVYVRKEDFDVLFPQSLRERFNLE